MKKKTGLFLMALVNAIDYSNLWLQGWRPVRFGTGWAWEKENMIGKTRFKEILTQESAVLEMKRELVR